MSQSRTTASIARWSATHPWRALFVWMLFVGGAVAAGSAISTQQISDEDYRMGQSGEAAAIIEDAGLEAPDSEYVLITAKSGPIETTTADAAAADIAAQMSRTDGVARVDKPVWSPDHEALLLPIELDDPAPDADVDVGPLQDITAKAQAAHPNLSIAQAGDVSIDDAINTRVADDLGKAEGLSLPIPWASCWWHSAH